MAEESAASEQNPEQTIFRNLYQTKILPPWSEALKPEDVKTHRSAREYTIALTNNNASEFGNITRVGWKGRVDYAVNEYNEEKSRALACQGDAFRDPNHLLQATISTIILLASGASNVPKENFLYTELYLKNIKDENGDHPPNISEFLKHMRYLKKQQQIELDPEYKTMPPDDLVVTKIKKSKIPVKINRTSATVEEDTTGDGEEYTTAIMESSK